MTLKTNDIILRKLSFFKDNQQKVHIKIINGNDKGLWRNGYVINISSSSKIFAFVDDVMGELTYLFEEIDEDIVPYKKKEQTK